MENNEEKKPKRPRIGENRFAASSDGEVHYSKVNYNQSDERRTSTDGEAGEYQRPYQPRTYNNSRQQGGYGSRQGGYGQGGYGNNRQQGGYGNNRYGNQGGYQPRQSYQTPQAPASEGAETADSTASASSEGYTPSSSEGGYQGGYNRYGNQNSYGNRQQGGYGNRQQGGYSNNRQQGGYGNRQQGGYGNNRQQGGYGNNANRRPQQGGYGNNGPRRQQGPNSRQQGGAFPRQGKSFTPRPKRIEYEMPIPDPNEQIRLNKFMANAGICSRREADEFIQQGLVKVNGVAVTELGTKISHNDVVEYDEKVVTLESKCYILLNKPKDCVTTSDDPNGRTTVMDLVKGACNERIYPVGRLDRNTTGVLLLTNDGDLASKLTHPKYVKKKIYHVWTDKDISEDDMQTIADGIELEDGPIHADAISYATDTDRNQAGIEIHSGRNRIVRRIFESLGYHVTKLDRVYFAGLTKKNLPRGRWRYLTQEEVNFLKMGSFE